MFWSGTFLILAVIVAFVATERYIWHYPRYEFVFWLVITTMFTCLLLISPDSPIHYLITLKLSPISMTLLLGFVVPMVSSFLLESSRAAALNPFESSLVEKPLSVNQRARAKQHNVNQLLDRLVYNSQTRWFAAWLRGAVEERQARIHRILEEANSDELNHIIRTVNVPKLFTYANYIRPADWKGGESTIEYIMEQRIGELGTLPRAALLHSLMKMGAMMFHRQQMQWACDLLCGAKGDELTVLKNYIDSGGDYNNLYKLLYYDVTEKDIQKKMLTHIEVEGMKVRQHNEAMGHYALKVISDVDDTLYSSGGRFPAGCDSRYPFHVVYPGCLALYEELDMGQKRHADNDDETDQGEDTVALVTVELPYEEGGGKLSLQVNASDSVREIQEQVQARSRMPPWKQRLNITTVRSTSEAVTGTERSQGGNLVFLSARPHAYKDFTENGSYRKFKQLYLEGRMHTTPTLLAGSLSSGMWAVVLHLWERFQHQLSDMYEFWEAVLYAASGLWDNALDVVDKQGAEKRRHSRRTRSMIDDIGDEIFVPPGEEPVPLYVDDGKIESDDSTHAKTSSRRSLKVPTVSGLGGRELSRMEVFMSRIESRTSSRVQREVTTRNWEAVAKTKCRSFIKYSKLYPEYNFVFFGDNGQGDVLASELVLRRPEMKDRLVSCFMHEVQDHDRTLSMYKESDRERSWKKLGVHHFHTYIGAAVHAMKQGLIAPRALHRVGVCAHEELVDLMIERPSHPFWQEVVDEMNADVRVANHVLKKKSKNRSYVMSIPEVEVPHTTIRSASL